jgi:GNAT superfamily N-acetyltransferase
MEPEYRLTTDPSEVDHDVVCRWLAEDSYWATGRARAVHDRSIAGSALVVGVLDGDGATVGFCRVVSDGATFAWLADVFVHPAHRGRGLGKHLVRAVVEHPSMQEVGRIVLATKDAHGLYAGFGFEPVPEGRFMHRDVG